MYCTLSKINFIDSDVSFVLELMAIGKGLMVLSMYSNTVFRECFDESMNNRHCSGLYSQFMCCINPVIFLL